MGQNAVDGPEPEQDEDGEGLARRQLDSAFQEAADEVERASEEANAAIQPDDDRHVPNAWLRRAGWAKHFAGQDRNWLSTLVRTPDRREKALAKVCFAVETVVWKAQQASRPEVVGLAVINYIN